jgi:4a-hydroxytetrahydrobiopterin dehydratase
MDDLALQTCVPCRGGMPPLDEAAARELLHQTPGWELLEVGKRLTRRFKLADFRTAMAFAQGSGEICEREWHHADISFGWAYCQVLLYTHKIGGLHQNDFVVAAKINQMAEQKGWL